MSNPKEICAFFLKNACNKGDQCFYRHERPLAATKQSQVPCAFFARGTCRFKDKCLNLHDANVRDDKDPNHLAGTRFPCKFFAMGNCKRGEDCSFSHVETTASSASSLASKSSPNSSISHSSSSESSIESACLPTPEGSSFNELQLSASSAKGDDEARLTIVDPHLVPIPESETPSPAPLVDATTRETEAAPPSPAVTLPATSNTSLAETLHPQPIPSTVHPAPQKLASRPKTPSTLSPLSLPMTPNFPSTQQSQLLRRAEQSNEPCQHHFAGGFCAYTADTCRFRHVLSPEEFRSLTKQSSSEQNRPAQKECFFYAAGKCRNGDRCPYLHQNSLPVTPATVASNVTRDDSHDQWSQNPDDHRDSSRTSLPRKTCNYFKQGHCKKGDRCAFSHDEETPPPAAEDTSSGWDADPDNAFGWGDTTTTGNDWGVSTNESSNAAGWATDNNNGWGDVQDIKTPWDDHNDRGNAQTAQSSASSSGGWSPKKRSGGNGKRTSRLHTPLWDSSSGSRFRDQAGSTFTSNTNTSTFDSPRPAEASTSGWDAEDDKGQVQVNHSPAPSNGSWSSSKRSGGNSRKTSRLHTPPQNTSSSSRFPDPTGSAFLSSTDASSPWPAESSPSDCDAETEDDGDGEIDPWVMREDDPRNIARVSTASTWDERVSSDVLEPQVDDAATWEQEWTQSTREEREFDAPRVELPCKFFGQGYCKFGDKCRFAHIPQEPEQTWGGERDEEPAIEETQVEKTPPVEVPNTRFGNAISAEHFIFQCRVQFGPGAIPKEVTTSFESHTVFISNIPQEINQEEMNELERLVTSYGAICDQTTENADEGIQVKIDYSNVDEAALAARSLNNHQLGSIHLTARIHSPSPIEHNRRPSPNRCWVKVNYPTPSQSAWCFYRTMTQAKQESIRLDGKVFQGRKVKASLPRVRRPKSNAFPILLENLPAGTTKDVLVGFCEGATLVDVTSPTYTDSPLEDIRTLMHGCGTIIQFEEIPSTPSKSKAMAFVRFHDDDAAVLAAQNFNNTKHRFLGDGEMTVQPSYYHRFDIPSLQFAVVEKELFILQDALFNDCKVQWDEDGDDVHVRLFSTTARGMARAMNAVQLHMCGEIMVTTDHAHHPFWDEYFDNLSSQKVLANLNRDPGYRIELDFRNRHVLLFGDETGRSRAKKRILNLVKKVMECCYSLDSLTGPAIRFLLEQGMQTLQDKGISPHQMLLDVVARRFLLWAEKIDDLHTLDAHVKECGSDPSTRRSDDCVICRLPAIEGVDLSCSHTYCRRCILHYIRSRISPPFEKLTCLAQVQDDDETPPFPCSNELTFSLIRDLLTPEEIANLFEASLLTYVQDRTVEFKMCPTRHCRSIYRVAEQNTVLMTGCVVRNIRKRSVAKVDLELVCGYFI
ncbi:hypothetical protein PQX77_016140 [Marasmius sp. AFHP31]|nr:hypothetical protein PQX77_016140 [Marasmius sp. AFHP31]